MRAARTTALIALIMLTSCGAEDTSRAEDTYRVDPAIAGQLPSREQIEAIATLENVTTYSTELPTGLISRDYNYVRDGPVGFARFEIRAAARNAPPADFAVAESEGPARKAMYLDLWLYRTSSSTEAEWRWHQEPPIKKQTRSIEADVENATVSRSEVLRNGRVRLPTPDDRFRYTWCGSFRDPDHPVQRCLGLHFWIRRCNYLLNIHFFTDPLVEIEVYDPSLAATADAIAAATVPDCPSPAAP